MNDSCVYIDTDDNSEELMIDPNLLFVIENIGNSCYIDSLLMALFYVPSRIDSMLTNNPKHTDFIYLQEYIKTHFVKRVRDGKNVMINDIVSLNYILLQCGWLNYDEIMEQQDVNELYAFLADALNITPIEFKKYIYIDNYNHETSSKDKLFFIPLALPITENVNVKDMLHEWLYANEITIKNNEHGMNIYHIDNIPEFVALSINRFTTIDTRINTNVIIQKKLCPFKDTEIDDIEWYFHSAICHIGNTVKSGHYYSLLYDKHVDQWHIFDNKNVPCLTQVKMSDKNIISKIKKECVLLLYQLKQ